MESPLEREPRYGPAQLAACENPEDYEPGGFHPVYLGDEFQNGRYRIVYKLFWGGFSTVWLARDKSARRWVALKIVRASDSQDCEARSVATSHPGIAGSPLFVVPERLFWIEGPNGRHLCLVLPALGPDLSRLSRGIYTRLNSNFARRISFQAAQALAKLHSLGLCHGDFTASNIVLRLVDDFDSYEEEDLLQIFRTPRTDPVRTISGELPEPHGPDYLVEPLDLCSPTAISLFTGEVSIIDFDQSFPAASGPQQGSRPGIPAKYLAAEACVGHPLSRASDVWALGCTIFRIRSGHDLFFDWDTDCPVDALDQIVRTMGGDIPQDWARTRFNKDGYVAEEDEPGDTFGDVISEPRPLKGRVRAIIDEPAGHFISTAGDAVPLPLNRRPEDDMFHDDEDLALREAYPIPLRSKVWRPTAICVGGEYFSSYSDETTNRLKAFPNITEREADLLLDLLSKIFVYEADKRPTAEKVASHSWFSFSD